MSTRTIFAVDAMDEKFYGRVVRSPCAEVDKSMGPLSMDPLLLEPGELPPLGGEASVLARGRIVRDALRAHGAIRGVLDYLSGSAERHPLFVQLGPSEAELINWEMLCDTKDAFIALDDRWPIARIIDQPNATQRPPSEMSLPVRLMAVISAIGIPNQEKEWEHLRDAVVHANGEKPWIKLKVLAGYALYDIINMEIQNGLKGVELGPIEETGPHLTQAIRAWAPNILHFFCHGHADAVGQSLELATTVDHIRREAEEAHAGSVLITAQGLATLAGSLSNSWLLVLNCCSSGKAGAGIQSMASKAVASGFPAVVAMLEPVKASDAYEFTRAFYPDAFEALARVRDDLRTRRSTTVEWTPIMYSVRTSMSNGRIVANSPEWSLPVLYVRGLEAQIFIQSLHEPTENENVDHQLPDQHQEAVRGYRVQAEEMARWLRTAGQQMSVQDRLKIMEYVLRDVPKPLWPTPEGGFHADDP